MVSKLLHTITKQPHLICGCPDVLFSPWSDAGMRGGVLIRYSDHGNNRTAEEAIVLHWTEYVTECSGMHYCKHTYPNQKHPSCNIVAPGGHHYQNF